MYQPQNNREYIKNSIAILFLIASLFTTLSAKNVLKKAEWTSDNTLTLTFQKKINEKDVNGFSFYESSTKNYRYIYNLKNFVIPNGHYPIKDQTVDLTKITQKENDLARVCITNSDKVKIIYRFSGEKIIFTFKTKSKSQSKSIQVVEKSKPKIEEKKNTTNPYNKEFVKSKYIKTKEDYIITIDAGHGGKDAGAVATTGTTEKEIVLAVARYVKYFLKKNGFKVNLTRDSDNFISLHKRTKIANDKNSDVFISIHVNSIPTTGNYKKVNGIETYFLSDGRKLTEKAKRVAAKENHEELQELSKNAKNNVLHIFNREKIVASQKLAIDVQRGMLGNLNKFYSGVRDSGVREGPFWVLLGAEMPSILVELGFINGNKDSQRLKDTVYQKRIAKGIADGVEEFLNKNFKE